MRIFLLYLYLIVLVVVPVLVAFFANPAIGMISLISLALAYLLFNLDKLESFKLYGLEAKLKQTISEANATIEQLKDLAIVLAEPTISLIATNGLSHPMPFAYTQSLIERINFILNELNIAEDEIERMNQVKHGILRVIHQNKILTGVNNPPQNLVVADQDGKLPSPSDYENFLEEHNLLTPDKKELIADLNHFIETDRLRRPETWG